MIRSALVHHHIGLGDHIVCNGLVREILKVGFDFLYLPVKKQNCETVKRMYSDETKIVCLPVLNDTDVLGLSQIRSSKLYRVGFEKVRSDWDVSFYDSVEIPFQKRWDSFKANRNQDRETALLQLLDINEGDDFILTHESGSSGTFPISILDSSTKIIKVEPITDCLIDWYGVIEQAKEVHCIDSSFIHFAQSIRSDGFFHEIRKPSGTNKFCLRDGWKTIKNEL